MSKTSDRYASSWQKRFADWMKSESSPLDREVENDLSKGSDASAQEKERAAYDAQEAQRRERHESDLRSEQALYARLHLWSTTRGAKIVSALYRLLALCIGAGIIFYL